MLRKTQMANLVTCRCTWTAVASISAVKSNFQPKNFPPINFPTNELLNGTSSGRKMLAQAMIKLTMRELIYGILYHREGSREQEDDKSFPLSVIRHRQAVANAFSSQSLLRTRQQVTAIFIERENARQKFLLRNLRCSKGCFAVKQFITLQTFRETLRWILLINWLASLPCLLRRFAEKANKFKSF